MEVVPEYYEEYDITVNSEDTIEIKLKNKSKTKEIKKLDNNNLLYSEYKYKSYTQYDGPTVNELNNILSNFTKDNMIEFSKIIVEYNTKARIKVSSVYGNDCFKMSNWFNTNRSKLCNTIEYQEDNLGCCVYIWKKELCSCDEYSYWKIKERSIKQTYKYNIDVYNETFEINANKYIVFDYLFIGMATLHSNVYGLINKVQEDISINKCPTRLCMDINTNNKLVLEKEELIYFLYIKMNILNIQKELDKRINKNKSYLAIISTIEGTDFLLYGIIILYEEDLIPIKNLMNYTITNKFLKLA